MSHTAILSALVLGAFAGLLLAVVLARVVEGML